MRAPAAKGDAGFTLIEVMFAIAILSMALVTVFGSSIGGARSASHARQITRATMMARCRITEIEAYLVKNQLPAADQSIEDPPDTGGAEPCCTDGITCEAKVERIELPSQSTVETSAGDQLLGRAATAAQGTSFGGPGGITGAGDGGTAGGLSALAGAMGAMGGGAGGAGGSGGLASSGAPSPREMAGTMLTTVYPTVKPLLEGAIRKLTVSVRWSEGSRPYSFDVLEYVANPGQTLPSGDLLNALTPPGATPPGATPPSTPPTNNPVRSPFLGGP